MSMMNKEAAKRITIERRITYEEELDYYVEVPFEMPDGTEALHVEITCTPLGEGAMTIDLGLKSPSRIRGWSGGARKEFTVGLEQATPGYLPGELTPGAWSVLLGAYRIPEVGCQVRIDIYFQLEQERWLKGDLHTHTVHSDGMYTLEEAGTIMEALGCDFIATTDHNTASQNFAHPKGMDIVYIPGMELTTRQGHANFLGIVDPLEDFRSVRLEDIEQHIRTAKEKGAQVVLNHPFCNYCPWEWSFHVDYDYVEVWNGPWADRNQRALDWWQEQLAGGRRLIAVGGSDTHRPHLYIRHAMPTTWVYSSTRTVTGILAGMEKGHVFISYSPEGPTIEHFIGTSMIGDIYDGCEGQSIDATMKSTRLNKGDTIRIISNRGLEEELMVAKSGDLSHAWSGTGRLFYRIEIWRYSAEVDRQLLAALSNPIYIREA